MRSSNGQNNSKILGLQKLVKSKRNKIMKKNFSKTKENGIDTFIVSFNKKENIVKSSEDETPEQELMDLKEDLSEMVIRSLGAVKSLSENILNNLSNESVMENLSEPFLQQMTSLAEDYVTTIHNYVMFSQDPDEQMEEAEAAKKKRIMGQYQRQKEKNG